MLYIMRHGMTDWNAIHRLQGRTDIPLNDEGIEMAQKAHDEYADVHFDICFYSPLKRAAQTAQIVAGDRGIPMICDERLREMSFGVCEGTMDYMTNESSEIFPLFSNPDKYVTPPAEAESIEELCRRTGSFLKEKIVPLMREGKDVLIVGHGAMNSSMIMQIKKLPKKDFWAAGLAKCRLMSFEVSEVVNNLQQNE